MPVDSMIMIKRIIRTVSEFIDTYAEELLALTIALAGIQGLLIAYSAYVAYIAR